MLGKKADAGFTAVVIILIIIVFLGWLINLGQRECANNNDCSDKEYCGSDNACHKIPVIERTVTESPTIVERDYRSLTGPFMILGLAVIIAAIILRYKRNKKEKKEETPIFDFHKEQKKEKKATKDQAKTYMILGAIAGAIIVCLTALIILLFL